MLLWHCLQWLLIAPWAEISSSSSYELFIASNISLRVFKDDICDIQWRRKYSSWFWLDPSCALLWLHLHLDLQLLLWHSYPCHASSSMRSTLNFHGREFSTPSSLYSRLVWFVIMIKLRTLNGNIDDKTYQWDCFNLMLTWKILWKTTSGGPRVWQRNPNFST